MVVLVTVYDIVSAETAELFGQTSALSTLLKIAEGKKNHHIAELAVAVVAEREGGNRQPEVVCRLGLPSQLGPLELEL